MTPNKPLTVDQNEIKFAMLMTSVLLATGWIMNSWIPVFIAAICHFTIATGSQYAPYKLAYSYIVLPFGIVKAHPIPDDPAAHHFAAFIGGILDSISTIALVTGFSFVGWLVAAIVFFLSNLNFWVNFCMMYWMYYVLQRLGLPVFGASSNNFEE